VIWVWRITIVGIASRSISIIIFKTSFRWKGSTYLM
jgi:hypothetical protein